jgi:hypothetical protein
MKAKTEYQINAAADHLYAALGLRPCQHCAWRRSGRGLLTFIAVAALLFATALGFVLFNPKSAIRNPKSPQ